VNTRPTFIAHRQAPKTMQPCDRAFHDPARAAEAAAMAAAIAVRDQGRDATSPQLGAMAFRIVAAIALHHGGFPTRTSRAATDRRHPIHEVEQLRDVRPIGGRQRRDERNPVRVGKNMMLRPGLAAIGRVRSSFFPRRIARREALSTTARARSSRPRRRNSVRSAACNRFHTPARCQAPSRRQHVIPDPQPISRGSIRHGMPLRSTKRIPVSTARSGIGARPAYRRLRGRRFGKRGSIRFHNASSTKGSVMPDHLLVGQATVPRLSSEYKRPGG
jgi:hypothetical protein